MTDTLETRLGELERANESVTVRLSRIKRKYSLDSNSTRSSQFSATRDKLKCLSKRGRNSTKTFFQNRWVQLVLLMLLSAMAVSLIAIAVVYILNYNKYDHSKASEFNGTTATTTLQLLPSSSSPIITNFTQQQQLSSSTKTPPFTTEQWTGFSARFHDDYAMHPPIIGMVDDCHGCSVFCCGPNDQDDPAIEENNLTAPGPSQMESDGIAAHPNVLVAEPSTDGNYRQERVDGYYKNKQKDEEKDTTRYKDLEELLQQSTTTTKDSKEHITTTTANATKEENKEEELLGVSIEDTAEEVLKVKEEEEAEEEELAVDFEDTEEILHPKVLSTGKSGQLNDIDMSRSKQQKEEKEGTSSSTTDRASRMMAEPTEKNTPKAEEPTEKTEHTLKAVEPTEKEAQFLEPTEKVESKKKVEELPTPKPLEKTEKDKTEKLVEPTVQQRKPTIAPFLPYSKEEEERFVQPANHSNQLSVEAEGEEEEEQKKKKETPEEDLAEDEEPPQSAEKEKDKELKKKTQFDNEVLLRKGYTHRDGEEEDQEHKPIIRVVVTADTTTEHGKIEDLSNTTTHHTNEIVREERAKRDIDEDYSSSSGSGSSGREDRAIDHHHPALPLVDPLKLITSAGNFTVDHRFCDPNQQNYLKCRRDFDRMDNVSVALPLSKYFPDPTVKLIFPAEMNNSFASCPLSGAQHPVKLCSGPTSPRVVELEEDIIANNTFEMEVGARKLAVFRVRYLLRPDLLVENLCDSPKGKLGTLFKEYNLKFYRVCHH